MASCLEQDGRHLLDLARRHRWMAGLTLFVASTLPVLYPPSPGEDLWRLCMLLLGLYLARRIVLLIRSHRLVRQLTHECQFILYLEAAPHLLFRLLHEPRFARRTYVATTLRSMVHAPSAHPGQVPAGTAATCLRRLHLGGILADAVLLLGLAGTFLAYEFVVSASNYLVAPLIVPALLIGDLYLFWQRHRFRDETNHLIASLHRFASETALPLLRTTRKGYRHHVIFRAGHDVAPLTRAA
ncbi:MAG: hypothetical protein KatS3mg044_1386 [Rhodothermaceae bacterium]|nr:MAG: hypothetical protein KatS3mg044_1386 [Rhodothermaceae bacterium]